jgi:hypothetical protein
LPNVYKIGSIHSGDYLTMFVFIVTPCIFVVEYQLSRNKRPPSSGFLRDVGTQLQEYTWSQYRRPQSALGEFPCFTSQITYYSEPADVAMSLCLYLGGSEFELEAPRGSVLGRNTMLQDGHAITDAVNRWLLTAAARVSARVSQVLFVVDKVASGQVFSEYFGFPCQNRSFHQLLHSHNHPGQVQWARIGRSAEWTQYGLHPPPPPIFK